MFLNETIPFFDYLFSPCFMFHSPSSLLFLALVTRVAVSRNCFPLEEGGMGTGELQTRVSSFILYLFYTFRNSSLFR